MTGTQRARRPKAAIAALALSLSLLADPPRHWNGSGSAAAAPATSCAALAHPIAPASWMADAASCIEGQRLDSLFLPGTHDSGMYALAPEILGDPFAPDADALARKIGAYTSAAKGWARAQEKTVYEQLSDGIRYIELRPCVDRDRQLRTCHTLYGPRIDELVDDIARFAKAHPKEIVLVQVSGLLTFNKDRRSIESKQAELRSVVGSRLYRYLVPPELRNKGPSLTIGEIWRSNRSVILLDDGDFLSRDQAALDFGYEASAWNGGQVVVSSATEAWRKVEKRLSLESRFNDVPGRLFLFAGQVSPGADLLTASLLPSSDVPRDLASLAHATNPVVLGWALREWSRRRLNIMTLDFYNRGGGCLVKVAMALDGIPGVPLEGCGGGEGDSTWGRWRAAGEDEHQEGWRRAKGRGAGYAWLPGDGFGDGGMFERCLQSHADVGCEKVGRMVYPRCAPGTHAVGCCACWPDMLPAAEGRNVVGLGGMCLDVLGESRWDGRTVELWDCNDGDAERFRLDAEGRLRYGGGTCVEAPPGRVDGGTELRTWTCGDGPNQKWTFDDGILKNGTGRCMSVAGSSTSRGTRVELSDCHGGPSQRWALTDHGQQLGPRALYGVGGKCLEDAPASSGGKLRMTNCNGSGDQRFILRKDGALVAEGSGRCVSTNGDGPAVARACDGGPGQRWSYQQGMLVGDAQKCLDSTGWQGEHGTPVLVLPCKGAQSQLWSAPGLDLRDVAGQPRSER
jgi:hypothetical protein